MRKKMKEKNFLNTDSSIESIFFDTPGENDFNFPQEFLPIDKDSVPAIYDHSKKMMGIILQYKELMMMYTCAIKEIRTRFEVLNAEFNVRHSRNPINFINTRLKRSSSIIEKMERNNIVLSIENIEENIDDVAGIRVICSYIDDIYLISKALIDQNDIELIEQKDYFAKPKPNGYRSLHMIVRVPVNFENGTKHVKVEVQIRTIAMDFWATLEHELKYKNQISDVQEIVAELKECAEIISDAESKMLEIRKRIEKDDTKHSEEYLLIEQIKKLDHPIE